MVKSVLQDDLVNTYYTLPQAMFDTLEADIVCIQELKIQKKDLKDDMVLVPGWDCFCTFPKHRKGITAGLHILRGREYG